MSAKSATAGAVIGSLAHIAAAVPWAASSAAVSSGRGRFAAVEPL